MTAFRDGLRAQTQRELRSGAPLRPKEEVEMVWAPDLDALQGTLLWEVIQGCPTGRRPQGKPRAAGRDFISDLAWQQLNVENVAEERDRNILLSLLFLWTHGTKWMDVS